MGSTVVVLLGLLGAQTPEPVPANRTLVTRVALMDLAVDGVDARVVDVVTASLLEEIRKRKGLNVIGMDDIRSMLDFEAEKEALGCSEEESCLAEIADALGVDGLVTGSMTRVGTEHVFGLNRIDQARAKVVGSFNQRLVAASGE